jgi:hypothetical protein
MNNNNYATDEQFKRPLILSPELERAIRDADAHVQRQKQRMVRPRWPGWHISNRALVWGVWTCAALAVVLIIIHVGLPLWVILSSLGRP